jgi:hypothetical protein
VAALGVIPGIAGLMATQMLTGMISEPMECPHFDPELVQVFLVCEKSFEKVRAG